MFKCAKSPKSKSSTSAALRISLLAVLSAFFACACFVRAQDAPQDAAPPPPADSQAAPDSQQQPDPPGRVARLNYMTGSVSFQPAGTKDWVDATPNRPLTTGDSLWADQNSRGEMHIDGTALHLSRQTGITFLNLNDQIAQIQLAQGSLQMRVRSLPDNTAYEIDTPNLAFA